MPPEEASTSELRNIFAKIGISAILSDAVRLSTHKINWEVGDRFYFYSNKVEVDKSVFKVYLNEITQVELLPEHVQRITYVVKSGDDVREYTNNIRPVDKNGWAGVWCFKSNLVNTLKGRSESSGLALEAVPYLLNYKQKINQILFGPPGTGKTYHTINKAVEVCDPYFFAQSEWKTPDERTQLKHRYNELIADDRIVFTTFHQNFSYEDFVEGIKPDVQKGQVVYRIEEGILNRLAFKATPGKMEARLSFDERWDAFFSNMMQREPAELFSLYDKSRVVIDKEKSKVNRNNSLILRFTRSMKEGQEPSYDTITKNNIRRMEEAELVPGLTNGFWIKTREIVGGGRSTMYTIAYNEFYNLHPPKPTAQPAQPHVLIIDEINRGNVSQIFGELITLIEEDKRQGRPEALTVTLPYSKKPFSLPSNLYIIGTMNTADRSVEALDTALRRRFVFEEMPPLPDKLPEFWGDTGIETQKMLRAINQRLEVLKDKNHTIGHAFFMGVEPENQTSERLMDVFTGKVLPLLEEFFYGELHRVAQVLGKGFLEPVGAEFKPLPSLDADNDYMSDRVVWRLKSPQALRENALSLLVAIYA